MVFRVTLRKAKHLAVLLVGVLWVPAVLKASVLVKNSRQNVTRDIALHRGQAAGRRLTPYSHIWPRKSPFSTPKEPRRSTISPPEVAETLTHDFKGVSRGSGLQGGCQGCKKRTGASDDPPGPRGLRPREEVGHSRLGEYRKASSISWSRPRKWRRNYRGQVGSPI